MAYSNDNLTPFSSCPESPITPATLQRINSDWTFDTSASDETIFTAPTAVPPPVIPQPHQIQNPIQNIPYCPPYQGNQERVPVSLLGRCSCYLRPVQSYHINGNIRHRRPRSLIHKIKKLFSSL